MKSYIFILPFNFKKTIVFFTL